MTDPGFTAPLIMDSSAAPGGRPTTQPSVDVVALTSADDFLLTLAEALAGQATVSPVDTTDAAIDKLWSGRRGKVLVIDTRMLFALRRTVELAAADAPHAIVVLFAHEGGEQAVVDALEGTVLPPVLPIPLDPLRTQMVLQAALSEAASRPPQGRRAMLQRPPTGPLPLESPWVELKRRLRIAGATGAVGLLVSVLWLHTGRPPPQTESNRTASPPAGSRLSSVALARGTVDELLRKARAAMRQGHYSQPENDCALLYYQSVQALDPANAEARDGLSRVTAVLITHEQAALGHGRLPEAQATLATLKRVIPGDERLSAFERQLTARQAAKAAPHAPTGVAPRPPAETPARPGSTQEEQDAKLASLAELTTHAIAQGRLLVPVEASARAFVAQMQAAAPSSPLTARAVQDLNAAYLRQARAAAGSADADRWLDAAAAGGASPSDIEPVRREVMQARARAEVERVTQLFHDRLKAGLTQGGDSASFYLSQLQGLDAAAYTAASHELADTLIERARGELAQGKNPAALVRQIQRLSLDARQLAAIEALQSPPGASPAPAVSAPVDRSMPAAAAAPTPATSAPGPGPPDGPVTADAGKNSASLRKLHDAPVQFPRQALEQNLGGEVTVRFRIDVKGEPQDVRVVHSTPPGIFDRAAVAAVKMWRYERPPEPIEATQTIMFAQPRPAPP